MPGYLHKKMDAELENVVEGMISMEDMDKLLDDLFDGE